MSKLTTFLKYNYKYNIFRCLSTVSESKKICIVGSGPAGFYTAQQLLKKKTIEVDIYEKLPAPFGLIRYGVAPDHPQIKTVITQFSSVAMHERCKFFGNINVGEDIKVQELLNAYHAIVFAYGAQNDKKLGIPGEDSKNVLSAREFVSWYNGHPNFVNLQFDLDTETVVVIGLGNVAVDVSRILLQDLDKLKKTDIAEHALETLMKSKVKRVIMVGRRSPLQVAFTTAEIREMTKLANINCIFHPEDFAGIPELMPSMKRPQFRLMDLLYKTATKQQQEVHKKSFELKFYRKPKTIISDSQGKVEKVVFGITKLKDMNISEKSEVVDTDLEEIIECGLVLKSVGYQSSLIDPSVPFDENKYIIPNKNGRVLNEKGMYCSGWIQTGPKGVIVPTMNASYDTAEQILDDIEKGNLEKSLSMERNDILEILRKRGVRFVSFEEWLKIDKVEVERGKVKGKPREKICSTEEMLSIANLI